MIIAVVFSSYDRVLAPLLLRSDQLMWDKRTVPLSQRTVPLSPMCATLCYALPLSAGIFYVLPGYNFSILPLYPL